MDMYGVGRITPGYEINDNPATTGRSIGYGSPTVHYGAGFTSWVQEDPASLKLYPLPPEGRASPDFTQGRMVGYGAEQQPFTYPGFLGKSVSLPVVGTMMMGTIVLIAVGAFVIVKMMKKNGHQGDAE